MSNSVYEDEEWLWWVDEEDRPLGKKQRKEIHEKKLIHREVALLLYTKQGKVLFQKRSTRKKAMPGQWSTGVAGHVDYGEEVAETMKREAGEELGIKGIEIEYVCKKLIENETEKHFRYLFKAMIGEDYRFILNKDEVDEVRFLSTEEIQEMKKQGQQFNPVFVEEANNFWEEK